MVPALAADCLASGGPFRMEVQSGPAPAAFGSLTYPRYAPLLKAEGDGARSRIVLTAWLKDQPVGLALVSAPGVGLAQRKRAPAEQRKLLSIMVHPMCRRLGLATAMLAKAAELAGEMGTHTLVALYSDRLKGREALEALLRKCGWPPARLHDMRIAGRAGWALRARDDWARFLERVESQGYASVPWHELQPSDHEEIGRLADALPAHQQAFDPRRPLPAMIPELSLVLKRRGAIVGWFRGACGTLPDSVFYADGYLLPRVQKSGWLVAGLRDVCERQATLLGPQSLSMFETDAANDAMQRFMERQLMPRSECEWLDRRYVAILALTAAAADGR